MQTVRAGSHPTFPTPYPDLNAVLWTLVESVQAVLGGSFVAFYLQGSFATGGFDRHSDVDYLVVIDRELSAAEVEALQAVHGRIYSLESAWAQHLEGSYFPKDVLRQHERCDQKLWYLDNGSRALVQSTHCNTVVVRWVVRQDGIALVGPPPSTLVDPIPVEDLRREIYKTLNDWGQEILANSGHYNNRFYQSFIVLSYCRMLHSLHAGIIASKRAGADWARANLDPRWSGLIDRTWAGRPVPEVSVRTPADPLDFASTLEFVRYIIAESEKVIQTHLPPARVCCIL